jgi:hypothetical protein
MATTYNTDIQKLYVAYFNRPADPAGLAYWETVVEAAKGNTAAVSASFAGSAEYKATYANMTNAQIVDAVYQNLFGRAAETAGKDYWADLLNKNAITIDNVVAAVAAGAQTTDLTAYNNKVTAAGAFTAALDTDAEKAGYTTKSIDLAKAFIASVTTDASLAVAVAPAALNDTVGKVVAAGGVFNVVSALQNLETAEKAEATFLAGVDDGDDDEDTVADADTVAANLDTANGDVADLLPTASKTVYIATDTSDTVKAALINDQIATNASALTSAQTLLNTANTKVAAVAGLQAAVTDLASAKTASTAAAKADVAANADLLAKVAALQGLNTGVAVAVVADGTATYTKAGVTADLIVLTNGKLALADGITETKVAGVGALLTSTAANETAEAAAVKAAAAVVVAQHLVDHLDVTTTETTALQGVATLINGYGDVKLATGALPTETQLSTQKSILEAKAAAEVDTAGAAHTNLTNFNTALESYRTAAASNPLVTEQATQTTAVKNATTAISDFNEAVAALNTAKADASALGGYAAAVSAAENLFDANGYHLQKEISGTVIGTASSDIYTVGDSNASISLFGLQGSDSLFIGSGYTVNTGALSTGNDAKLEVFVKQVGTDTLLSIETSTFGSHAATPEVVEVTLVGVTATNVHLDANGIITVA